MVEMKKHIRVVGAVIVEKGKVLCAQRPADKNLPLKWEFPGGKIEGNESHEEALKRELKEELDCTIRVLDPIDTTVYEYDFGIVELTTYYAEVIEGEVKRLEHTALRWVETQVLHELDWAPADIPAIKKIQENVYRN